MRNYKNFPYNYYLIDYPPTEECENLIRQFKKITDNPEFKKSVAKAEKALKPKRA